MPGGAKKQKVNSKTNKKNAAAEAPAGPSTATAAVAPAGVAAAVAPPVLPLELQLLSSVLQFSDMRQDQASICRLLVTSKAAAAVVAEDCKGQLHINLNPQGYDRAAEQHCASQAAWLRRNGLLVRELTATSTYGSWDPSLQHLKTTLGTLLPTVASSMPLLTKLTGCLYVSNFKAVAALSQLLKSLAALTSLQTLNLHLMRADAGPLGGSQLLVAGLAQHLPGLTHLDLFIEGDGPAFMHMDRAGLHRLPASLQSLGLTVKLGLHDSNHEMFVVEAGLGELWAMTGGKGFDQTAMLGAPYPSNPQPPLKLGHLTALKALKPYNGPTGQLAELAIREGDVLPPNLTELVLDADFRSLDGALTGVLARPTVGPLMPLKNLQVLVVYNSKASAAQLQQLSAALTPPAGSLKEISLGYTSWKAATGAAAAWPHLPLIDLSIYERMDYSDCGGEFGEEFDEFGSGSSGDEQDFAPEEVAELLFSPMSQLTALTSLVCDVPSAKPSAQLLANTLSGLSRLQTLSLTFDYRHEFPHHFESVEEVRSVAALAKAIAALPNLSDLQLGFPLPGVAAAIADEACARQLTPLTSLKLKGLSDADVALLQASPAGAALPVPRGF